VYVSEKIAVSFGNKAKKLLMLDENKEQIIVYGAINLIQTILNLLAVVCFGFIFGVVYEALIFSFVGAMFRKYSGGVHATSPGRCLIIGTSVTTIFAIFIGNILSKFSLNSIIFGICITNIASFFIVYRKAPVDSIKKPIKKELRNAYKRKSICFMSIMWLISIILLALNEMNSNRFFVEAFEAISLGLFWQSISLTKGGIYMVSSIDGILQHLNVNGGEINEK
jgi:accessory gene regulator B